VTGLEQWLLQLQADIHGSQNDPSPLPIQRDNQRALALITAGSIKARTKNIDAFYHSSRDQHKRRIVNYCYLRSDENVPDIFTEALTKDGCTKFLKAMGL